MAIPHNQPANPSFLRTLTPALLSALLLWLSFFPMNGGWLDE